MSVFYCDGFTGLTAIFKPKADTVRTMQLGDDDWLWEISVTSRRFTARPRINTQMHGDTKELVSWFAQIEQIEFFACENRNLLCELWHDQTVFPTKMLSTPLTAT